MTNRFGVNGHIASRYVCLLAVTSLCAATAFGQTLTTGGLSGLITDPSGAVVPNATVTLTSIETGAVRRTTSSSSGEYHFAQLAPGRYTRHLLGQRLQVGFGWADRRCPERGGNL